MYNLLELRRMKNILLLVNYNDYDNTIHLVENVKNYKIIDKIVIVDNNSKDNSFDRLNTLSTEKIVVIKNDNSSLSSGLNFGIKEIEKKYKDYNLIVSNSDIIIKSEDTIKNLIEIINNSDDIALISPIIEEHGKLNRGWKLVSPKKEILFNILYFRKFFEKKYLYYPDKYYENKDITQVDVCSGCFYIIKGSVLKEVDYYDEGVFLYYEENILAKKIKNIKKSEVISLNNTIIHNHSVTIDKAYSKINKFKILKKSQIYYEKNFNSASICDIMLMKFFSGISLIIMKVYLFIKGD